MSVDVRLHDLFMEQALVSPDALAVITSQRVFTYADVAGRAARVARWLGRTPAGPNRLVAVLMQKGWEQVVAVLGVLGAGAAYLPIDADLPTRRVKWLLEHGRVEAVLTQSWLSPETDLPVCAVDREEPERAEAGLLRGSQSPDDLAYVIYTSGSTGEPKGVMISHRGAVNTVLDVNERFRVGPDDRVLALSSLSFDLSVYDIFGLLAAGGAVIMPDAATWLSPRHWTDLARHHSATVWNSVPALASLLARQAETEKWTWPPSLRLMLLSGDWIPVGLPARLRALSAHRGLELVSLGGATEASIWSILHVIRDVDPSWTSIPYGRSMRGQSVRVLDEHLEPAPAGVTGELYIGGTGLALGYWRDAARTAERFVVHPATGQRLYRTGDLGRSGPDGQIEFLGRQDLQVKVQGHRIELGEIEACLQQHERVAAAVVAAVGERESRRLVAFVVPTTDEGAPGAGNLRSFLAARLPAYMVPGRFTLLDELPLSSNGKVDRRALSEMAIMLEEEELASRSFERPGSPAGRPPRDAVEQTLVEVWAEVLGLETVGVDDDFFDLGGHSVLAVQLLARVESAFGKTFPLTRMLAAATVAQMAALLREECSPGPADETAPRVFFWIPSGEARVPDGLDDLLSPARMLHVLPPAGGQEHPPVESLLEMLLSVQPRGPWYLGGDGQGGLVALELARRLRARHGDVGLVALVDAPLLDASSAGPIRRLWSRWRPFRPRRGGFSPPRAPYDAPILLVRGQPRPDEPHDLLQGWEQVARGGVEVRVVPASTGHLLEGGGRKVAEAVRFGLEDVEQGPPTKRRGRFTA